VDHVDALAPQAQREARRPERIEAAALRLDPDGDPGGFRALGHPARTHAGDHRLVTDSAQLARELHDHVLGPARAARLEGEQDAEAPPRAAQ
jgi:hypothetical protein